MEIKRSTCLFRWRWFLDGVYCRNLPESFQVYPFRKAPCSYDRSCPIKKQQFKLENQLCHFRCPICVLNFAESHRICALRIAQYSKAFCASCTPIQHHHGYFSISSCLLPFVAASPWTTKKTTSIKSFGLAIWSSRRVFFSIKKELLQETYIGVAQMSNTRHIVTRYIWHFLLKKLAVVENSTPNFFWATHVHTFYHNRFRKLQRLVVMWSSRDYRQAT